MGKKSGSLLGGALLITGSCVGAGMLALPITTGLCGFIPSLFLFLLVWLFMSLTGLLLLEVNGWFQEKVNLFSMVEKVFGRKGRSLCWVLYLSLFYALLVAYISGIGTLFSTLIQSSCQICFSPWIGSVFFVFLFGVVVCAGTRQVDLWNRVLMVGKVIAFLLLTLAGVRYVQPELLARSDPSHMVFSLSILIVSFGFHNMVPSLTAYLGRDIKRVRQSIWLGGGIALGIYLVWEILVLGAVPLEGEQGLLAALHLNREGAQALAEVLQSPWIAFCAKLLAFFAILTSFLAQALSLVHFLADGFKISYQKKEPLSLCALALIPPLIFSLVYPQLFFKALNFAGGICAVALFGFLPVLMVWKGRKKHQASCGYVLSGGKPLLSFIFLFSLFVFCFQILNMLGLFSFRG